MCVVLKTTSPSPFFLTNCRPSSLSPDTYTIKATQEGDEIELEVSSDFFTDFGDFWSILNNGGVGPLNLGSIPASVPFVFASAPLFSLAQVRFTFPICFGSAALFHAVILCSS
mgnify:CR=1 FL=1